MAELKNLGLKNYMRTTSRIGGTIDAHIPVTYDDLNNIHSYLLERRGILENTPSYSVVNPQVNGVDGANIVINKTVLEGKFYNVAQSRPKTLEELLVELYGTIDTSLATSSVSSEMLRIKNVIGINKFDDSEQSSDNSLHKGLDRLELKVKQLAADCFNREKEIGAQLDDASYSISGSETQTQEASLIDKINVILEAHGGIHEVNHNHLDDEMMMSSVFDKSSIIAGGTEVFAAPYNNNYADFGQAPKFYNPMAVSIKLSRLFVVVSANTLVDNLTVTLYKDGQPTEMELFSAGGSTGQVLYADSEIVVEPGSFINIKVKAGEVGTGSIHLDNISIVSKRIQEAN